MLATIGCAVVTGIGAVNNAARAQPGDSVVIIGAGGVGLNVAQGAGLAGCDPIIAVDLRESALVLAREFGATHAVAAGAQNVAEAVRELKQGKRRRFRLRHCRSTRDITQALDFTRKGGLDQSSPDCRAQTRWLRFPVSFVMQEKRLIGSLYGSGQRPLTSRDSQRWIRKEN